MGGKVRTIASRDGGDLSYRTSPPSDGAKAQIFERCDLCTIGIGKSLYWEDKQWKTFRHNFSKAYRFEATFTHKGTRRYVELMVDEWCLEALQDVRAKGMLGRYLERCAVGFELE